MKPATYLIAFILCISATSCSTLNLFKGPEDFARNHEADLMKWTIDRAISEEVKRLPPEGYKTKPYSAKQWTQYWNNRIYALHHHERSRNYRGPSNEQWIDYIISQRRAAGLPKLQLDSRNQKQIEQGAAVDAGATSFHNTPRVARRGWA